MESSLFRTKVMKNNVEFKNNGPRLCLKLSKNENGRNDAIQLEFFKVPT